MLLRVCGGAFKGRRTIPFLNFFFPRDKRSGMEREGLLYD